MATDASGLLPVDKPAGPTSHDVVAAARRALGTRRVGHTGTLDPFASGLLILCVGAATRLVEFLIDRPKAYQGAIRLGRQTDTDDGTGNTVAESEAWRGVSDAQIADALARHTGALRQTPPTYSAKKVGGRRMHRLARAGVAPSLDPVAVQVYELRLLDCSPPKVRIAVRCSSGTYIRALARDIGAHLGCLAHLAELRRTRIGAFDVERAIAPDALSDEAAVEAAWMRPARAIAHLPWVPLGLDGVAAVEHGSAVPRPIGSPRAGLVALLDGARLCAVAHASAERLQPRKVFHA